VINSAHKLDLSFANISMNRLDYDQVDDLGSALKRIFFLKLKSTKNDTERNNSV
jgi:hypothetical protein